MTKREFLTELQNRLPGLSKQDIDERLAFYSEMIDDRMEEGRTEDEAVSDIGSVDDVAEQIIRSIPLTKIAKERIKPKRRLKAWEILLIVLGSPIWLSLGIAVAAVILSLYVVLWSVIAAVWAVFVSLAAGSFCCVAVGGGVAFGGSVPVGMAVIGVGVACAGLTIFCFFGCRAATKGLLLLTRQMAVGLKKCFVKKEGSHE